jgi:hypothetical protein
MVLRRTRNKALIVAALVEILTGVVVLLVPSLIGGALFGVELTGAGLLTGRVLGIALIGLGVACWPGPPIAGMFIYSTGVALYLAYVGATGVTTGFLLWPAVGFHLILSAFLARAALRR